MADKFISTAHIPDQDIEDGILARPIFTTGLFEKEKANIKRNRCPLCNRDITEFRNARSQDEFKISGMCQECQDVVFGVD